jgi:AcrR family transcriptional regulator
METGRWEEHAADTRQALLAVARRLFAEQGYAATGTEQIVAQARLTRGALYHHFRGKAALFRAVMEEVALEVAEQVTARQLARQADATQPGEGAWEQLRAGFQAYLDVCTRRDFQRIVLIDGPAALGRDAWEDLVGRHGYGLLAQWLSRAADQGAIPRLPIPALTRLLAALIAEASLVIARADDPEQARREAGEVIDCLLSGLSSGQGAG